MAVAVPPRGRSQSARARRSGRWTCCCSDTWRSCRWSRSSARPARPDCWWLLVANALFGLPARTCSPGRDSGRWAACCARSTPCCSWSGSTASWTCSTVGRGAGSTTRWCSAGSWRSSGRRSAASGGAPRRAAFWSTVLHAAYFSYYFIIVGPGVLLRSGGATWPRCAASCWSVMTTFVVCYLVFIFFPVAGPYYVFPRPDPGSSTTCPARLVYDTLARAAAPTERPSPARTWPRPWPPRLRPDAARAALGLVLLVPTMLLTVGVVYCQMHYGVDAIAGLLTGTWS